MMRCLCVCVSMCTIISIIVLCYFRIWLMAYFICIVHRVAGAHDGQLDSGWLWLSYSGEHQFVTVVIVLMTVV